MKELYQQWLSTELVSPISTEIKLPHPNQIGIDSRNIQKGQWFLPIVGGRFDGHNFIHSVVDKAGVGFFYEAEKASLIPPTIRSQGVAVRSTLSALHKIALGWRQAQKKLTLVALTGSVGKTTTRELAKTIFASQGPTHGTDGNLNNEIGVPLTLLKLSEGHRFSVIEMGARHCGDIQLLCGIADPDIVACLNVGVSHLGEFGSLERLFSTKMEIYNAIRANALAIAPADDPRILSYLENIGKEFISFGRSPHSQIRVTSSCWLEDGGMEICLDDQGATSTFQVGLGHEAYPINVCAAVAIAKAAGIGPASIQHSLKEFIGLPGRYFLRRIGQRILIDDCYNAAPASMIAGLNSVNQGFRSQTKVLVLGDILELGPTSDAQHFEVGTQVAKIDSLSLLVTVGESGKIIGKGALSAGVAKSSIMACADVHELIAKRDQVVAAGTVIYVKASNGVGLKQFIDQIYQER